MCMYDHAPRTPEERRAMKRELKEAGLIQIMKTKNETSTRHFTAYRILK